MPSSRLRFLPVVLTAISACSDPQTEVTQVWSGARAAGTCATTIDGYLWCWGYNGSQQVGDGTTEDRRAPVKVAGNLRATFVSVGFDADCAIADERLLCWGAAGTGGDGSILSQGPAAVPTIQAAIPDPIKGVAAGAALRCVEKLDGSAWCWGDGQLGLLGNGAQIDSASPVPVTSMSSGVVSMLLGTFALKDDGSVWGWGPVDGANLAGAYSTVPVSIVGADLSPLANVIQISGSGIWACALTSDGRVLCWGGIPGSFERTNVDVAVEIDPSAIPPAVTEIAVGDSSLCVLDSEGVVQCEGRNDDGQLGDGTRDHRFTMAPVQGLSKPATHITSGAFHTCAMLEDRTLWCWGANRNGQLGVGDLVDRLRPAQVRFGG